MLSPAIVNVLCFDPELEDKAEHWKAATTDVGNQKAGVCSRSHAEASEVRLHKFD